MTPSFARALADPEWAVQVVPKAIKRLLAVCRGREPRGLMRDVIRLVTSLEALDEERQDALSRVELLEDKLEDKIEVERALNEEIESLRARLKLLENADQEVENVDVLADVLKDVEAS